MERPKGILFDLDGVVYNADRLIEGSVQAIEWIRARGVPYLFVTNTSSRPRSALVEKLRAFGIPVEEQDILNPAAALAEWLRGQPAGPVAAFVRPAALVDFAGWPAVPEDAEEGAAYVVIGDLGELWDFRTLNRAFRLLHVNPHAQLIALGMTRFWMALDGISLDVAPFVAALEHASGRKALVFGKPAATFFHAAAAKLGLATAEILMLGDDIRTDVLAAQEAGLQAALVRTGKFRPADLESEIQPLAVLESIADLPAWWNEDYT